MQSLTFWIEAMKTLIVFQRGPVMKSINHGFNTVREALMIALVLILDWCVDQNASRSRTSVIESRVASNAEMKMFRQAHKVQNFAEIL